MRFPVQLMLGWLVWTVASGGVLLYRELLTVDRMFIAGFVGFLAVATVTLPEKPSRGQVAGTVLGVVAGLVVFGLFVFRQLQYLLAG